MSTIEIIVLGAQALVSLVIVAGIPWAITISSRLSAIETAIGMYKLSKTDSCTRHEKNEQRIHALERAIDRCPNCTEKIVVTDGSDT